MSIYCKTIYTAEKGSCFYDLNFPKKQFNSKNFYEIPELGIFIDENSYRVLKESSAKFFYAVQLPGYANDIKSLKPLTKEEYKKFSKNRNISELYYNPKILGEGTYGRVIGFETTQSVIKESKEKGEDISEDIVKEISVYRYLKNINDLCIPRFQGFNLFPKIEIQLEKGINTLERMLPELDEYSRISIMLKLAKCLKVIADQYICNLDLKPANMIVTKNNNVHIIDWGLSEVIFGEMQTKYEKQTLWWRSPELCIPMTPYNHKADIFSLGIIFLQLYTQNIDPPCTVDTVPEYMKCTIRLLLNYDKNKLNTSRKIQNTMNTLINGEDEKKLLDGPSHADITKKLILSGKHYPEVFTKKGKLFSEDFADLLSKMLEINPVNRIDYDEIILHPFFQYLKRESIPSLPVFVNNMPSIPLYNYENRCLLFKKIVDIVDKDKLNPGCIFLSYQLFDMIMHKRRDIEAYWNDCGVACLLIASKLLPSDHSMVFTEQTKNRYTSLKNLLNFEKMIIETLEGNLLYPSLYSYYYHKNKKEMIYDPLRIGLAYYNRMDVYKRSFKEVNIDDYTIIKVRASYGIAIKPSELSEYNKHYFKTDVCYLDIRYKDGDTTKISGFLNSVPVLEVI